MFIDKRVKKLDLVKQSIDGQRRYTTPDGNSYPSLTTVLGVRSKGAINEWKARVGEKQAQKIGRMAANRGNIVHDTCEQHILKSLSGEEIPDYKRDMMPIHYSVFNKMKRIINARVSDVYGLELPLYSDKLRLAGTSDLICKYMNVPAVVDYKGSDKVKKREWISGHFMQGAGYAEMFKERYGVEIPLVVIIIATVDNDPQIFVEKTSKWLPELVETRDLYLKERNENV